ncbi:family 78 glycoside hydrolase catalytic domain [Agriterribacter sp.]|uniref:alpha-L-rhamnosidase n=1 Tax=Agriterribacter sp. TaxID=2821509 RepID=UPI002B5F2609|nr:family 78 glycoside hydrolase catalytic domain [Agriterribacter sp.]HRP54668.1 family 78 glycoside hydrolase catalytic domain [Agriterribacter sp.]
MNDRFFRSRMSFFTILFSFVLGISAVAGDRIKPGTIAVTALRCDNAIDPLGIDSRTPQFSWQIKSTFRNMQQAAYQVLVSDVLEKLNRGEGNIWNSGKTVSSQSAGILYQGVALESRKKYYWKVLVWSQNNPSPSVSETATFEMGLMDQADWSGDWVGFPSGWIGKVHYFRRVFSFHKEISKARAYVAGIGYNEMEINGKKVGDHVLDPATSDFSKTVYYTTYDIKNFLQKDNVMVIAVAPGWYGMPKLRMQMEFFFTDGTMEVINSGSVRNVTLGPVVSAGIFDGEVYDARLEKPEWDLPSDTIIKGLPNQTWGVAPVVEAPGGKMMAQQLEPIRVVDAFSPVSVKEAAPGIYVMDAGQNMAGWVALKVKGEKGTKITLRFAEVLYDNGTVNQENLRTAAATDIYILKGEGEEKWEPRFTYHGFRYMQVEGWPGKPAIDNFIIKKVRSDVEVAGQFKCSNDLLNRINQMVQRTEASNLHSIPTDCPQRDERMGWLNDLTVRIEQAIYNFNLHRFYAKYIRDVCDTQDENGEITDTAPYKVGGKPADPVSVSFLLLALKSYEYYGNTGIIRQYYPSMKAWVEYLTTRTKDGIVEYSYYGDWSPPAAFGAQGHSYGALSVNTPGELMSTGYLYYSAKILAQMSEILGKANDRYRYERLAQHTLEAFNTKFWDESKGGYGSNNQSCNAFAIFIGAPTQQQLPRVMASLVKDVKQRGYHLTTGNLCTKYLLEMLTENGEVETAYKIATQTTYPGWGYMLSKGATTLWERWEYETGGSMNSHNHPMMGSVGSWLYKYIAGILPDIENPGFAKFILHPYIINDLEHAEASYRSVKGEIRSAWKKTKGSIEYAVSIPANTVATVYIPTKEIKSITESGRRISRVKECKFLRLEEQWAVFEVGSGDYLFNSKW